MAEKATGRLEKTIEYLFGRQVNDVRAVRYGLYATYTFGSGDYGFGDLRNSLKLIFKGSKGVGTIKRILDGINELDDNLDMLPPEEILRMGEVTLGSKPSPVLFSSPVPKHLHENAAKLEKLGVISKKEIYAFANLAAYFILEEARNAVKYQETGDIQYREALVENHMRQTEVTGAFVMHLFKRDKKLHKYISNGGVLNYEKIQEHFPKLNRMCRLTQYKDDMLDVYKDLLAETETKRPFPNVVLLHMDKNGELYKPTGELCDDAQTMVDYRHPSRTRAPAEKLPGDIRRAVSSVTEQYREISQEITEPLRSVVRADLNRIISDGIYITKDGEIEDTERKWHQVFAKRTSGEQSFRGM